jgi:hypothetical protein
MCEIWARRAGLLASMESLRPDARRGGAAEEGTRRGGKINVDRTLAVGGASRPGEAARTRLRIGVSRSRAAQRKVLASLAIQR